MSQTAAASDETAAKVNPAGGLFVSPPMTVKRYAELQGTTMDTVYKQIERGMLPTVKIGKYRLIDTYTLARECLENSAN